MHQRRRVVLVSPRILMRTLGAAAVWGAMAGAGVMWSAEASAQSDRATRVPTARTVAGVVRGALLETGITRFAGIPFAAPPVRERRWKPPQPVARWVGVRAADRFGPQCMQARDFADMVFRNDGTSEDCLYLNVWTPATTPPTRMPVLVYFYGGGFTAGDGSEPRYDGENVARRGVVVVTMSYRLGIFGSFSHPELSAESTPRASGNYGLMDQAAALRWVQANIASFGGDPARVTIAGESAGSFSVSALMASPMSKALIAGAIGESGAFFGATLSALPLARSEENGVNFAKAVGATSLAQLRALSSHELLAAASRRGVPRFGPNVDGVFFPEAPPAIYAAGRQARVPLLAGWNSEESSGRSVVANPTPENLAVSLNRIFGTLGAEALTVYGGTTTLEVARAATDLASDQFIGFGTWKWLEEHGRSGQPVYRYFYSRARPPVVTPSPNANANASTNPWAAIPGGAAHSAEIEYAMGNLARNTVFAWTDDDRAVSATMMTYFVNFVKSGNPNGAGVPEWPRGHPDANGVVTRMRIDVQSRAEREPRERYLFLQRAFSQR